MSALTGRGASGQPGAEPGDGEACGRAGRHEIAHDGADDDGSESELPRDRGRGRDGIRRAAQDRDQPFALHAG